MVFEKSKYQPIYKASEYNTFSYYEPDDIYIGLNLISGGMYVFTAAQYSVVRQLLEEPEKRHSRFQDLKNLLVQGRFLVKEDFDERELLKLRNRTLRYNQNGLAMVIAPTLACNFDCPYCYVDREKIVMSEEVIGKVKRFFKKRIERAEAADIVFTGGEPLIVPNIIEELTGYFVKESAETKTPLNISIVTNGYLLNEEIIERLKKCGVQKLQITLDGYKDYHDRYRYTLKKEGTYDKVLENLVNASANGFDVVIRSNLNKDNYDGCFKLLDDLSERIRDKSNTVFASCMVRQPTINNSVPACNVFTNKEFSALEPGIQLYAAQKGFKVGTNELWVTSTYCGANSLSMFVLDSYGNLLKCWCNLGDSTQNKVGHIDENGDIQYTDLSALCRWTGWDPFEIPECRECKVLPICLGGCMYYNLMGETDSIDIGCSHRKHNIDEILRNVYLLSVERSRNKI